MNMKGEGRKRAIYLILAAAGLRPSQERFMNEV